GDGPDKDAKSRFNLPFMSRKSADTSKKPAPAKSGNDSSRKRLILAGLVLLVAAGTFAFTNLSGGGKRKTPPRPAPSVSQPAPPKAGTAPRPKAGLTTKVKPVSLVPAKSPHAATQPPAISQTGMPDPRALEASNPPASATTAPGGPVAAAPADPVTTASLPPVVNPPQPPAAPQEIAKTTAGPAAASVPPPVTASSLPDPSTGSKALREAAASGNPSAQFVIASRYLEGRGTKRDAAKAASWYQKAASAGLAPAQYRLGTMFERGNGVPRDMNAARLWYERAAERGNVKAMHNLAVIYASANSGMTDYKKAKNWFSKAASHGLKDSQYNLAVIHERGLAGPADRAKAFVWYSLAAKLGDRDAGRKAHELNNVLTDSERKSASRQIAAWKPAPPSKTGNFVAITDPAWQVRASARPAPVLGPKPALSGKQLILTAQRLLDKLGYHVGTPDGIMGNRTANAVRLFQLRNGLAVNGMVSNDLVQQLQARSG
ncbi:MAG TPA: hypothetical protein ENJ99_00920, partial [Rhizobiales bacterium]|nr:hypothetical protein [Hyphomicrobiales bacterium]